MRPEMKNTWNENRHAMKNLLIFTSGKVKCNFVSGVVEVKRPIKKCIPSRARYKDKYVGDKNAGIYWICFRLNQHSNWYKLHTTYDKCHSFIEVDIKSYLGLILDLISDQLSDTTYCDIKEKCALFLWNSSFW